jgi:ABC-2 type transport system permease protein
VRKLRLILTIARHEWRLLLADRMVLVSMLAIAIAFGYAGLGGLDRARRWRTSFEHYQQLQSQHLNRFERRAAAILDQLASGQRGPVRIHSREFSWGPHVPAFPLAWVPPKAALPAAPLSAAAVGDTEVFAAAYSVGPFNREPSEVAPQPGNPLQAALGHFDLAFVVVVLFPLFIVTLTFDALAGERERGTLPLVLSQPVGRRELMAAKLLARGSLAIMWPAALIAGVLLPEVLSHPGAAVRLGLWMAATIAYGLFWTGLSFAVNTGRRSAAANAVTLGSAWLVLAILSPALIHGILQAAHPVPPRAEWVNTFRATNQDARLNMGALPLEQQREAVQKLLDLAREAFEGPRRAQEHLLSRLRFLSPAVLLQGTLFDLAGAGPSRYEDFLAQTKRFQHEIEMWARDRRLRQVQMTPEQYASIPRFRFVEETAGTVFRLTAVPLAVLWCLALAVMLIGFRRARHLAAF